MTRKQHFQSRGGSPTVFNCDVCGRRARIVDQGNTTICQECWDLAGMDNTVNDNGPQELTPAVIEERDRLAAIIVARGGDLEAVKLNNEYLWPPEPKTGMDD
jgi:hypothetical protein